MGGKPWKNHLPREGKPNDPVCHTVRAFEGAKTHRRPVFTMATREEGQPIKPQNCGVRVEGSAIIITPPNSACTFDSIAGLQNDLREKGITVDDNNPLARHLEFTIDLGDKPENQVNILKILKEMGFSSPAPMVASTSAPSGRGRESRGRG